jgi:uroporphyrin-III C-methyltransferase
MKPQYDAGKVYLVGAGPGDPELLTLKAWRLIRSCDVIIYDALVNTAILKHTAPDAEQYFVGQPRTPHRMSQDDIENLMIAKANEGKSVVRLKGGDPFLFGRGGEEGLSLISKNIAFEVVPGVSAGNAVPAYAGIPVTHRGLASSVAFVTGHECDESGGAIDLKTIAGSVDTLILFMGVKNLAYIVEQILDSGKAPDTPLAIVEQGTTASQRVRIMSLATVLQETRKRAVRTPALIIVGEVVSLRKQLKPRENESQKIYYNTTFRTAYDDVLPGLSRP